MAVNAEARADKSQERFENALRDPFVMSELAKEERYNVVAECDHLSAARQASEGLPRACPRQHSARSVFTARIVA